MLIESYFDFLVRDYGLTYQHQEFRNCFGGHWTVHTYSYYNDNGCFTIHEIPQRGEYDFYAADRFTNVREDLCQYPIDILSTEMEIWEKHSKFLSYRLPLYKWSSKRFFLASAEVIKTKADRDGEFFGIKIVQP